MRIKNLLAAAAIVAMSLSFAQVGAQETTADGKPKILAGTVHIDETQVAFLVSAKKGGGTVTFEGNSYEFSIGGLGVGGIGVAKYNAVGAVYNMDDISQFPGTFIAARAGATVGDKGGGYVSLSNSKGVIMDLKFSGEGVALSVGVDGMIVSMK